MGDIFLFYAGQLVPPAWLLPPRAWSDVVVRWAEAGLDQRWAGLKRGYHLTRRGVESVSVDGNTGTWGPSGCDRVDPGHQESGGQAQCIPRALGSGDKRFLEPSDGEVDWL